MNRQPKYNNDEPLEVTCYCSDPEVDALLDLMAQGYTQHEASRLIWGPARDVRLWVRREYVAAFPWLRLPGEVAA